MENISSPQSPTNATYVEPSSETILEPGLKLDDLLHRNMTQPYVLQRLRKRQFAFIADLKGAVGQAMKEHPFTEFVNPSAKAHTEFLSKFFNRIATEATATLRPKYGRMYGFEDATLPNAEMVAWAMFEYR